MNKATIARERARQDRENKLNFLLAHEQPEQAGSPLRTYPEEYGSIFQRFYSQKDEARSPPESDGVPEPPPSSLPLPQPALSNKALKKRRMEQIAQLKMAVPRPELVEVWDVCAPDPRLLLHLKSCRSTVEVPRHWGQKKRFLQNKRGFYKRIFKLPDFIERTGISKLRDPMAERDSLRMVRQKMRDRMNPRLGRIDIDYQVLHDAFFRHQTRPHLTEFGDIYFEGKEEAMKMRNFRPGRVSEELRKALGIGEGAVPPWIISMHKFGPPPSYPSFRLPPLTGTPAPTSEQVIGGQDFEYDLQYRWGEMRPEEESELHLDLQFEGVLALEQFGRIN